LDLYARPGGRLDADRNSLELVTAADKPFSVCAGEARARGRSIA